MNMLAEIKKARKGEPSRVKLAPAPPKFIAIECGFRILGYHYVSGTGFGSREDLLRYTIEHNEDISNKENISKVKEFLDGAITPEKFIEWCKKNKVQSD